MGARPSKIHTVPPPIPRWDEAEIVASPTRRPASPQVLVRRLAEAWTDPMGNECQVIAGLPSISLFTGAGGMDLGLERSGFVTLCQHEWAPEACETLIANRPQCFRHSALIQGDIHQTPTSMILGEAGLKVGECHLVTGGPPCQGFSTANSTSWRNSLSGIMDARNDLVFEFLRCVREIQPRFFVFENVPGFTRFNKGSYLARFLEAAHGCYYELVYGLVNCVEYGVPQNRCRFICNGTRRDLWEIDGTLGALPKPECFGDADRRILRAEHELVHAARARELRRPPGIRYFPGREVLVPPDPYSGKEGRSETFLRFYRELEAREPDRLIFHPQERAEKAGVLI